VCVLVLVLLFQRVFVGTLQSPLTGAEADANNVSVAALNCFVLSVPLCPYRTRRFVLHVRTGDCMRV
jgi:hypothetical protein